VFAIAGLQEIAEAEILMQLFPNGLKNIRSHFG